MPIFMHDNEGGFIVKTLGEVSLQHWFYKLQRAQSNMIQLLPLSFGPDMLKDTQEALSSRKS